VTTKNGALQETIEDLRYQILTPSVTTMGPCCTEGCDQASRGCRECPLCLCEKLDKLTGGDHFRVDRLYNALMAEIAARRESENAAEALLNRAENSSDDDD
jgi:hypothetical protein